jgi:hypothetical protein
LLAKLSVVAPANIFQDEGWEHGSAEDILQGMAGDAAAIGLGAAV